MFSVHSAKSQGHPQEGQAVQEDDLPVTGSSLGPHPSASQGLQGLCELLTSLPMFVLLEGNGKPSFRSFNYHEISPRRSNQLGDESRTPDVPSPRWQCFPVTGGTHQHA